MMGEERVKEMELQEMEVTEEGVVSNVEKKVILQSFAKMQRTITEMMTDLKDQIEAEKNQGK